MSATVSDRTGSPSTFRSPYRSQGVTFLRMVRSEWIKSWSLRSTWWVVAMSIVLMAGLAVIVAAVMHQLLNDPEFVARMQAQQQSGGGGGNGGGPPGMNVNFRGAFNGAVFITIGYQFAALTVAVLGVLAISNEYSSGMIRATLSASPRRLRVLLSKLLVLITTTLVIGIIGIGLSWLIATPILRSTNNPSNFSFTVDFADPTQQRQILGAILYLVIIALMSFSLGAVLRATAGGIFSVVAILWVIPLILGIIVQVGDVAWVQTLNKYLPSNAGGQIVSPQLQAGMLDAWPGIGVTALYAAVLFVVAAITIKRRDA
jgi:ABC-2 type transport system permease protein